MQGVGIKTKHQHTVFQVIQAVGSKIFLACSTNMQAVFLCKVFRVFFVSIRWATKLRFNSPWLHSSEHVCSIIWASEGAGVDLINPHLSWNIK